MPNNDETLDIYQSRTRSKEEQEKARQKQLEKLGKQQTHTYQELREPEKPNMVISNVSADIPDFSTTSTGLHVSEELSKLELVKEEPITNDLNISKPSLRLKNNPVSLADDKQESIDLFGDSETSIADTPSRKGLSLKQGLSKTPDVEGILMPQQSGTISKTSPEQPFTQSPSPVRSSGNTGDTGFKQSNKKEGGTVNAPTSVPTGGSEFNKDLAKYVKDVDTVDDTGIKEDLRLVTDILEQASSTKDTSAVSVAKKEKAKKEAKKSKEVKKSLQAEKDYGIKNTIDKTSVETLQASGTIVDNTVINDSLDLGGTSTSQDSDKAKTKEEPKNYGKAVKNLILITEGEAHMIEYFHRNKVYPSQVIMDLSKLRELLPYFGENDDVLIVIKGLTDFTLSEIYACLRDITDIGEKLNSVRVLSNVEIGAVDLPYYHYEGDLFYGDITQIIKKKKVELDDDGNPYIGKHKKPKKDKSVEEEPKYRINPIMQKYTTYNNSSLRLRIYGRPERKEVQNNEEINILNKIVMVDLQEGVASVGCAHKVYRNLKPRP